MVEYQCWRSPATCLLDSCRTLVFLDEVMNEVGKLDLHSIEPMVVIPSLHLFISRWRFSDVIVRKQLACCRLILIYKCTDVCVVCF